MGIKEYSREFKARIEVPGKAGFLEINYSDGSKGRCLSFDAHESLRTGDYQHTEVSHFWFTQSQLPASKEKLAEILNAETIAELKRCAHELPAEIGTAIERLD